MLNLQYFRTLAPVILGVSVLAAGCATPPQGPAPVESRSNAPGWPAPEAPRPAGVPPVTAPSMPSSATGIPSARPASPPWQGARTLVHALLPPTVTRERDEWGADIVAAFGELRLAPSAENFCASIAVIEQESGFQSDPVVPGLSRIAWREIEARRQRYLIPKLALDAALAKPSPDGRSYRQRIDSLRTERQMSALFTDMIDELPGGKRLLSGYNPVRTGGPMQVSVAFAEAHAREKPYAGGSGGNLREAVFTRRGGLHFGIAHLLDYPVAYRSPLYRFADFNAGHYSSRNAAFQQALARLTGKPLVLDGDLLSYANGEPSGTASTTQKAVLSLAGRLKLGRAEINAALLQEKHESFARSTLYQRVFALADQRAGSPLAREVLPRIDLKSPKITRKLTTAWFADRVNMRYGTCMERAALASARLPVTASARP